MSQEQAQLSTQGNIISVVNQLVRDVRDLKRRNAAPTTLNDFTDLLGIFRAGQIIFGDGDPSQNPSTLSGIAIGEPGWTRNNENFGLIGESQGYLQFALSASTGKAYVGGGAILMDEDGLTIQDAGDAITFFDSNTNTYAVLSMIPVSGGSFGRFQVLVFQVNPTTNQIINGGFETGSFSSWSVTDPGSKLSVTQDPLTSVAKFVAKFATGATSASFITQALASSSTTGAIITMRVLATGGGTISAGQNGGTINNLQLAPSAAWRNITFVYNGSLSTLKLYVTASADVYIDDIVVRKTSINQEQNFTLDPTSSVLAGVVQVAGIATFNPNSISGSNRFASGAKMQGGFFLSGFGNETVTGTYNDFAGAVNIETISIYRFAPSAATVITGLKYGALSGIASSYEGKLIAFINTSSYPITVNDQDAGSTAEWRFELGGSNIVIPPNQTAIFRYDGTTQRWRIFSLSFSKREVLTAARTYYVRTDGNDTNTGLANTAGGAFLTIQKAIDVIAALDLSTYNVTIQVADGTYTGTVTVNGPWTGSGTVTLKGNTATPANVILTSAGANGTIFVTNGGRLAIQDMEIRQSASVYLVQVTANGYASVTNIRCGSGASQQLRAVDGGILEVIGNYAIVAGGTSHWVAASGGVIRCQNRTITITGTPAFTSAFGVASNVGAVVCNTDTFSGSATGPRYNISTNGVIQTSGGGATYLPGDSAGVTATGGQYA